ncbi:Histone acetyltransferase type B catalytic subunit [Yarrowia sp. B02]|nr:Histone acetyltransferase type B catalytic subunit [Yarrowia sp. B02]
MDIATEWTTNANEALTISLGPHAFHPIFTYPIYGDAETVLGYKDFSLNLQMDPSSMLPCVSSSFSSKLELPGVSFDDPVKKLLEFLPEETYTDVGQFEQAQKETKPVGEEFGSFEVAGEKFRVLRSTLLDPETLKLHLRLQIFVPLFIEAGSYIDHEDDRWEIYVVYNEKNHIVGFSTVYCYWFYEPSVKEEKAPKNSSLADLQKQKFSPTLRKRISQFVILPPFQGAGLGGKLYSLLFENFYADKNVYEITVEDPSEAFDDLRDRCDLKWLSDRGFPKQVFSLLQKTSAHGEKEGDSRIGRSRVVAGPFWTKWLEQKRLEYKLAHRQFARCFEMVLLACLEVSSPSKKRNIKDARLFIKKRVYVRNREFLEDLGGKAEIMSKLQETYESMEEDYGRIMKPVLGYVKDGLKKRERDEDEEAEVKKPKVE